MASIPLPVTQKHHRSFPIVIVGPLGVIAWAVLRWVLNQPLMPSLTIALCVALLSCGIVEMVRYESRRRQPPPPSHKIRVLLSRQVCAIPNAQGDGILNEILKTVGIVTAALGDKAGHDFLDHLGDLKNPQRATAMAVSYLEGLICRDRLEYAELAASDDKEPWE